MIMLTFATPLTGRFQSLMKLTDVHFGLRLAARETSRATQPTVHAGCFRVPIIHGNLTWSTGSVTSAQTSVHAIVYGHTEENLH